MRKLLLATAALTLGAGVALADSVDILVTATNDSTCDITEAPASLNMTELNDYRVDSSLTYECNFTTSPTVTITSANGGVVNGANNVDYGVYLNDVAPGSDPSAWQPASGLTGDGEEFDGITTAGGTGTPVTTNLSVALLGALPTSGLYEDTLTIDISA